MDEDVKVAVATAREFLRRANALRVVLVLDREDRPPAMIDCEDHQILVTEGDMLLAGEGVQASSKPLPEIRPIPATAISLDLATGELSAPIGAIEHLAFSVKALAHAFGGLTVATAEFETRDLPITFAARDGEPVVLEAGDDQYELDV